MRFTCWRARAGVACCSRALLGTQAQGLCLRVRQLQRTCDQHAVQAPRQVLAQLHQRLVRLLCQVPGGLQDQRERAPLAARLRCLCGACTDTAIRAGLE